ncbi:MAG: hypothetical protein WDW38_009945 [Sanguina aurantia]
MQIHGMDQADRRVAKDVTTLNDDAKLQALGYQPLLKRNLTAFSNFATSFSIISIMVAISGTYGSVALTYGGPVGAIWGWVIVSFMSMTVALSMAEICSAFPTAGGLYWWSARMAGPKWGPFASWTTGYFNLLGQAALTAGMCTGADGPGAVILTNTQLLGVYAACLVCHGLINSLAVNLLGWINSVSAWWNLVGVIAIIIIIPAVAPSHQAASFVFGSFTPQMDMTQVYGSAYNFLVAMLMSQWTMTGYDASAHLVEETTGGDIAGPMGIISSVAASAVVGFFYIVAITFSIQDYDSVMGAAATGNSVAQLFWDAFMARFSSGNGAIAMWMIIVVAGFCCGSACVTGNARVLFAFSRDRAVPGHQLWAAVAPWNQVPVWAVWGMTLLAFLLGVPMVKNITAFSAVTSIATIGLYISYGLPVFFKLLFPKNFQPGPFYMGRFSIPCNIIAISWILVISVVFCLPTIYPIAQLTLNYAPVAVGIVMVGSMVAWFFPFIGAYSWFKGPIIQVEDVTLVDVKADISKAGSSYSEA